ncbi:hypothetical protein FOA52_013726 [Chlamydomonas sp. UWO 241]|nr:hypothetical protein FOA52_013726 [Chlamydomonas sp. UWO 241]
MPPLTRRDLRTLVRKLGVVTRPHEQKQAMNTVAQLLICDEDDDSLAFFTGAIPALVQLLGAGSTAGAQEDASLVRESLARLMRMQSSSLQLVPFLYWCSCWGLGHQLVCIGMQREH